LGVVQLHVVMSTYNVTNTKHIQNCDKLRSFLNAQLIYMSSSQRNDVPYILLPPRHQHIIELCALEFCAKVEEGKIS